jgi:hypothetical protein
LKENHDHRVLLIFIPIFLVRLLWSWFHPILGIPSDDLILKVHVDALTVGMAVLCLMAYKFGNRNRFVSFLLVLFMLVAITVIAIISYQVWELLVIMGLSIATILLTFVLAGWCCQERYSPLRFMLWMAMWTMVIPIVGMITFSLITEGFSDSIEGLIHQMSEVLFFAVIFAICIYVMNLPFMILAFTTPFFRKRFYVYFHLKSMPIGSPSGTESEHLTGCV